MPGSRRDTPGTNMQIACGTSLQAALTLGAKIATGEIESGIAGGSDTVSDSPIVFGDKFQHRLIDLNRARTGGEKLEAFKGFSFGELTPVAPSTQEPRTGLSMGEHCELMAQRMGHHARGAGRAWRSGATRTRPRPMTRGSTTT